MITKAILLAYQLFKTLNWDDFGTNWKFFVQEGPRYVLFDHENVALLKTFQMKKYTNVTNFGRRY